MRFVGTDPQVMQLNLRLGPGERQRALEGSEIAIFVGKFQQLASRVEATIVEKTR